MFVLTCLTKNVADSVTLMLCLAEVSNHPIKPSCLQKLSRNSGFDRFPSLGSSHWNSGTVKSYTPVKSPVKSPVKAPVKSSVKQRMQQCKMHF